MISPNKPNKMQSRNRIKIIVDSAADELRIDIFLHRKLPQYSRSFLQNLVRHNFVRVGNRAIKPSYKILTGDNVTVEIPVAPESRLEPQDIPLDIVFEDEEIVVINKAPGMVVHPGAGVKGGTLVNALLFHCGNLPGLSGGVRPGIVHRLDKNTSGLLVVAKTDSAYLGLSRQFSGKTAFREYQALVWHRMNAEEGTIETRVNRSKRDRTLFAVSDSGKLAITYYQIEQAFGFLNLLRIRLATGRTHQIRIHFNHIHHPVFGDPEYHGRQKQVGQLQKAEDQQFARKLLGMISRQALHAFRLGIVHPKSGQKMEFTAPPPADFQDVLGAVRQYDLSINNSD